MSDELKPCPFCGSPAKLSFYSGSDVVFCTGDDCGAEFGGEEFLLTKDECIRRWNRRVQPAEQQDDPVGWQFLENGRWHNGDDRIKDHRANTEAAGYQTRNVYARPADQAVKLPERKPIPDQSTFVGGNSYYAKIFDEAKSWNACLDAVAKLNGIEQ